MRSMKRIRVARKSLKPKKIISRVPKVSGQSLSDFLPLKPAEYFLFEASRVGRIANLGDHVPRFESNEKCVRSDFIRFLLLRCDERAPIHERAIWLRGAFVEGDLDLNSCDLKSGLVLENCFIQKSINAQDANLYGAFNLQGSYLKGNLIADRFTCTGGVFLRYGFTVEGQVFLMGASIEGDLDCSGGKFEFKGAYAIAADRVMVSGSINLYNGFSAKGAVRFPGAEVGCNLDCCNGRFEYEKGIALNFDGANIRGDAHLSQGLNSLGEVSMMGVIIGGNLECNGSFFKAKGANALSADRARVGGNVNLADGFVSSGEVRLMGAKIGGNLDCISGRFAEKNGLAISLDGALVKGAWLLSDLGRPALISVSHANVGVLIDDIGAWQKGSLLDGFVYKTFGGQAAINGEQRVKWLMIQSDDHISNEDFRPQPWKHLRNVLHEMGQPEDAKVVGISLENHLRNIGRKGKWPDSPCDLPERIIDIVTLTAHYCFGKLAGYGYRPINLVMWMLGVWLACGALYSYFSQPLFNSIAPTNPLIFQNINYNQCRSGQVSLDEIHEGLGNWPSCTLLQGEYSTFSAFAYSLDLILPVVDLGQENSWGAYIPPTFEGEARIPIINFPYGYVVRIITWFEIMFGWISSLLLVAIVSGFARRNDEN